MVYPAFHLRCGWCWWRTANLQPSRSARSRFPSTSSVRLEGGASPRRLLKASPSTEALNPDQKKLHPPEDFERRTASPSPGPRGAPRPPWCVKPRFRHKSFLKFFSGPVKSVPLLPPPCLPSALPSALARLPPLALARRPAPGAPPLPCPALRCPCPALPSTSPHPQQTHA